MIVLHSLPAPEQQRLAAMDQSHIAGSGLGWSIAVQSVRLCCQRNIATAYNAPTELEVSERIEAESDIAARLVRWLY